MDFDSVCVYPDWHEEPHRTRKFQEELRLFFEKCGLEYDEAFVSN